MNRLSSPSTPTRSSRLPNLATDQKNTTPQSISDQIYSVKLQTRQMETEIKRLRSKIQRNKNSIKERNKSVKKVTTQTRDKQYIKTATPNTLRSLRESVTALENTLEERKQQLSDVIYGDKLAQARELEYEIQVLYLEKKRMIEAEKMRQENESIIFGELKRLRKQASTTRVNEQSIDRIQSEIDDITDKLFAYSKSEARMISTKRMKMVHDNIAVIEAMKNIVSNENEEDTARINKNYKKLKYIQELEQKNIDYLQSVIDEESEKIEHSLLKLDIQDVE